MLEFTSIHKSHSDWQPSRVQVESRACEFELANKARRSEWEGEKVRLQDARGRQAKVFSLSLSLSFTFSPLASRISPDPPARVAVKWSGLAKSRLPGADSKWLLEAPNTMSEASESAKPAHREAREDRRERRATLAARICSQSGENPSGEFNSLSVSP